MSYYPLSGVSGLRIDDEAFQNNVSFMDVKPGLRRLQVQVGACVFDTLITMPLSQAVPPVISFSNKGADCTGGGGSSRIQITGGSPPFLVSFSGRGLGPVMQFDNLPAGVYPVLVEDANGCEWNAMDTIDAYRLSVPVIDTIITSEPCLGIGNVKLFIGGSEPPYRFEVGGLLYASGAESKNLRPGVHDVKIYNAARCVVQTVQIRLPENGDCDTLRALFVPSAFTPNGDGKNDLLSPMRNPLGNVAYFIFRVYNRSGQILFQTTTPGKGWDGNYKGVQQPMAAYVWMFEGLQTDGRKFTYSGTTVLIR